MASIFNNSSLPTCQFLRQKILLKKVLLGEMLNEKIIEFRLRGAAPPGRICTPITD